MPVVDVAAEAAAWWEWYDGEWPGSTPTGGELGPAFPEVPLAVSVAILVDGSWLDITPFVYGQERADIQITRGKPNEAGQVDPARATMQLNNRDGQFSPRNPTSPLYGKIGRNTRVRVQVAGDTRFTGEISEWPQRWDTTGTDVYVPVEAAGILRRLQQGTTPLKSTLYRGLTSSTTGLLAYWPAEDDDDATQIASAVGGSPMVVVGSPDLASNTSFKCSAALPALNSSRWTGGIAGHSPVDTVQYSLLLSVPVAGSTDDQNICSFTSAGAFHLADLVYHTGGDLELRVLNSSDTEVLNTVHNTNLNGHNVRVVITFTTSGLDIGWAMDVYEVAASTFSASGTLASMPLPQTTSVQVNNVGAHTDIALGHITVHTAVSRSQVTLADELKAYVGETAGRRLERLCSEEGIAFAAVGGLVATAAMGAQLPGDLVALLRECETADGGILYESRGQLGLAYRTRDSLSNQPATLTLDYSAAHLSGIEPTDDDQNTRNDITATRTGGSSYRAVLSSGMLSVQAPPAGVGRYDEAVTVNVETDGQLPDQAGWRLLLGTVDEPRYPVLSVNLARDEFTADLAGAARVLDIGDRLVVTHPPAWLPPGDITQLALGFQETLAQFTHTIDVNCAPESPWGAVGVYEETDLADSRYTSDGSTLAEDLTTAETDVDVATASGPLWSHDDGDYDITIGGERMTVTAVAGASSPQTFTVTRSVNGVTKTHTSGAAVELATPTVYAI